MEIILVALATLVVLTAIDADRWPKQQRAPKRVVPRRRRPRTQTLPHTVAGLLATRVGSASAAARWWWE
jgi:hypothetical protein